MKQPLMMICAGVLITSVSVACIGPDHVRPEVSVDKAFRAGPASASTALMVDWQHFNDPALLELLNHGQHSVSEREALARLQEAQAQRRQAVGGEGPQLSARGGITRDRSSGNTNNPMGGSTETRYRGGFDLSWEIDVVGGVARTREASDAFLARAEAALVGVRLSWQGETALAYVGWRQARARLAALSERHQALTSLTRIAQSRAAAGGDPVMALTSQANLESSQAMLAPARAQVELALERLALLTSSTAGSLAATLAVMVPQPQMGPGPSAPPVGLVSDVLRRRPDVMAAEQDVAYTTARIGAAMAELWPSFTFNANLGLESIEAGDFAQSSSRFWSLGPGLRWNIFSYGRVQAGIDLAEARQQVSVASYERTVRTAIYECETALWSVQSASAVRVAANAALDYMIKAQRINAARSHAGVNPEATYAAQRAVAEARLTVIDAEADYQRAQIILIKALGGGWPEGRQ